jgi:hypothetical protein
LSVMGKAFPPNSGNGGSFMANLTKFPRGHVHLVY